MVEKDHLQTRHDDPRIYRLELGGQSVSPSKFSKAVPLQDAVRIFIRATRAASSRFLWGLFPGIFPEPEFTTVVSFDKISLSSSVVSDVGASHGGDYQQWIKFYDTINDSDRLKIKKHIDKLEYKPFFSIVMPVYNTPEKYLRESIGSMLAQIYTNWELCIADDASSVPHVKELLEEVDNMATDTMTMRAVLHAAATVRVAIRGFK